MKQQDPVRAAVQRDLQELSSKKQQLEEELARIQRMLNDLKAVHNIDGQAWRRDMEDEV